ncbi:MAG: sugar phosphate isomerase/epimerase [Candidatus Latescibacteria bacterium]|nr:sugar phosphate isomerase/epimerase [Candidatus Latescibacterota bacterium]
MVTRRNIIKNGCAATGALWGFTGSQKAHAWPPGPDKNTMHDLSPGNTPVRLGADLIRGENESITDMVQRFKKEGHTGAFVYRPRWEPSGEAEIAELNAALKTFDVVVFEYGGYVNMLHPDAPTRQKFLKRLAECIEIAEKINCPMVGTISGSCDPDPYGINVHPDNWTLPTWKLLIKGIRQVLGDTAGSIVKLGMEAQVTTNLDGPLAHKRLMEDVGDDRCAVNLDPTNMVSLHNYYHTTELLHECFDMLGEAIYGCHAKDTYIWPDKQTVHVQEVCPGRGVMDYETYLVRMSRLQWPRTLKVEHIPKDQYTEADAYIKKTAAKTGVTIYG